MWSALAAVLQAFLSALFKALGDKRKDEDRIAANKEAAKNEASVETQQAINETSDEIARVPDSPVDPDELARQLRAERSSAGGSDASRKRRPF